MTGTGLRRRDALLLAGAVAGVCLVVGILAAGWDPPPLEDFRVYRDAAQRVLDGLALYPPGANY